MDCDIKPITNNIHENLRPVALMFPRTGGSTGEVTEDDPSQESLIVSFRTVNVLMMDNPLTPHPGV